MYLPLFYDVFDIRGGMYVCTVRCICHYFMMSLILGEVCMYVLLDVFAIIL